VLGVERGVQLREAAPLESEQVDALVLVIDPVGRDSLVLPGNGKAGIPRRPCDHDVVDGEGQLGEEPVEALHPGAKGLAGMPRPAERVVASERVLEIRGAPLDQRIDLSIREVLEGVSRNTLHNGVVHGRMRGMFAGSACEETASEHSCSLADGGRSPSGSSIVLRSLTQRQPGIF